MSRVLILLMLLLVNFTCIAYALPSPNPPQPPHPPHAKITINTENYNNHLIFTIKNVGSAVAEKVEVSVSSKFISFSSFLGDIHPEESKTVVISLNQSGKYTFHILVSYFEGLQKFSKTFEKTVYIKSKTLSNSVSKSDRVVVNLRSDITKAKVGQEFSLTLSVVNLIGNPNMTLQVVLQPPSGMSITSSEFAQTGFGQYTGVFHVRPGGAKAVKIDVLPNNPGNFTIKGVIAYYFGKDKKNTTIRNVYIPIKVVNEKTKETPEFTALCTLTALILVAWRRFKWGR